MEAEAVEDSVCTGLLDPETDAVDERVAETDGEVERLCDALAESEGPGGWTDVVAETVIDRVAVNVGLVLVVGVAAVDAERDTVIVAVCVVVTVGDRVVETERVPVEETEWLRV